MPNDAFGNPINPISAKHFNSKNIFLLSPSSPFFTSSIFICFLFPFPPFPPLLTKHLSPSFYKSLINLFLKLPFISSSNISYTKVPTGTYFSISDPSLPFLPLFLPPCPLLDTKCFFLNICKSKNLLVALKYKSPPFPPSPPSGFPDLTFLSLKNE